MKEYTVSELSNIIKGVINDYIDKDLRITCEISSIKSSGDNKWVVVCDNKSMITVTFWRCQNFPYIEGDKVIIHGSIQFYEKKGYINVIGRKIEKLGIGDLQAQYQKNYEYLEKNGYFSKSQLQLPLPNKIDSIGVLTAKDGDALQDFLYVLKENNYTGKIIIYNCNVQGNNCSKSIIKGIEYFTKNVDNVDKVDILLLTRGGGSYEDLMGFSDMDMLKKLYECKIYTISAIGHQNDIMLSDLVANHRSPTPSLAGSDISLKYNEYPEFINNNYNNIIKNVSDEIIKIKMTLFELENMQLKLPNVLNELDINIKQINNIKLTCYDNIKKQILDRINILENIKINMLDKSHEQILNKGYSILTSCKSNKIINNAHSLKKHKKINILFNKQIVTVEVNIISIQDEKN
jgi:exodeoxyribonuclease VII large subunit